MNVQLTREAEELIRQKVESGRYNSASEVVREALRLLEEREQIDELRREEIRNTIDEGLEALRRGEAVDGEEVFARLEAELDAMEERREAG